MNVTAPFTAEDFDRAALNAGKQVDRWRWETTLLSIIAAEPKHRWPMAKILGIQAADFSAEDNRIIYRALEVGHGHGRRICALLIRNLLIEEGFWDDADERPFVTTCCWGPGPLASFATRALSLRTPAKDIADALDHVRELPVIPSLKWRAA